MQRAAGEDHAVLGAMHELDALGGSGEDDTVLADHGNCELMHDPATGGPHTSHTTNPVPVLLLGGGNAALAEGRLADIAPTLLELMGLPQPPEMTGGSLMHRMSSDDQKSRKPSTSAIE